MNQFLLVFVSLLTVSVDLVFSIGYLENHPHVKIGNGELVGIYSKSRDGREFASFMGIPYANQPDRFEVFVSDLYCMTSKTKGQSS